MSRLDKNRFRNQTVCFRATYQERRAIEERIVASGIPKGEYYLRSLLHQQINIYAGKFESDKLSIEIRRLRESLAEAGTDYDDLYAVLVDCRAFLEQMLDVLERNFSMPEHRIRDNPDNNQMPLP